MLDLFWSMEPWLPGLHYQVSRKVHVHRGSTISIAPECVLALSVFPFLSFMGESSVSWHFFMSPFMLSLRLFFGRSLLLLPETSRLSDFAQIGLGSRLKQWPNHLSILFSRNVTTCFTCASFLMSLFLMWSNPVFPLAHIIILISAVFSLFSSFLYTVQHSEPYVIAGLMIVLKTLSFNSTGIFLSHTTPDTSFHFIHPILILLLTPACEPPSLVNSAPNVFEGCYCRQFSINNLYCGVCIMRGSRRVLCRCSADLQPIPLKHNSPCLQVFLHFLTSHSTHHQVVREHHRPVWILVYGYS